MFATLERNFCSMCLKPWNRSPWKPWNLIRPIRGQYAIQFGHVGNAHIGAWAVARFGVHICVRALHAALRICNECIYFIPRFHDLTFGNAVAGDQRWPSVGHFAFFSNAVGFGFGYWWIVAHVQQRQKTKHFIWTRVNKMRQVYLCLFFVDLIIMPLNN